MLGGKSYFCPSGVCYSGSSAPLVVQCVDLVDAYDDLIHFAFVCAVGLPHQRGLNLSECGLACHVVSGKVGLAECVVIAGAKSYGANWENGRRYKVSLLLEEGARVIRFPTIQIAPPESWDGLDRAIDGIESYHWVIFTSANGVRFFFSRLRERGRDVRDLKGLGICTIGPATARSVEDRGLRVDIVPDEYISEGILAAFEGKSLKGKKILLPRAEAARDVVPEGLERIGAAVDVVTAYRTVRSGYKRSDLQPLIDGGKVDVITFTSPSTVVNFKEIMGRDVRLPEKVKFACLGPVTAAAAKKHGFSVDILQARYTIPGMVEAIAGYFAKQ